MDSISPNGLIPTILLGLGLAASTGLNTFLPLLILSAAAHFGYLDAAKLLNGNFAWVASSGALTALAIATVIEVLGDKVPTVDHALDVIGTVARPLVGAFAAASVFTGADPGTAAIAGLIIGDNYKYMDSLLKLQQRGLVRYVGCSLNSPHSVPGIVADGRAQALQFPASVLDARFIQQGILGAAPKAALFARSVYLQGLLLMPEEKVPGELEIVIPVRRALEAIARAAGLTPEELYMRYVLTHAGVTSLVIGAETPEQVRHNAVLVDRGPLDAATFEAVTRAVPELPEFLVVPRQWSKRMPDVAPAKA